MEQAGEGIGSGSVDFGVDPVTEGKLYVTACMQNKLPLQDSIVVSSQVGMTSDGGRLTIDEWDMRIVSNPVSDRAEIVYSLANAGHSRIGIYDVSGRLVSLLANGPNRVGRHAILWNRQDRRGVRVAPGVYFCRMEAAGYQATREMLVVN